MYKTLFWNKNKSIIRSDILVTPSILNMIGNVKNKNILDLGCGDGTIANLLYKKGANIIGVDKNKKSIILAKMKEGEYICKNIKNINFKKEQFDIIYSSMVFLFLKDNEIDKLAKKAYSYLKKDGLFIIADIHPLTELQEDKSLFVKHKIPQDFNYFKTSKLNATIYNTDCKNVSFDYYHRSLNKYIKLIISKGFSLVNLDEPQANMNQIKSSKNKLSFENKNPTYIIFKFKKD